MNESLFKTLFIIGGIVFIYNIHPLLLVAGLVIVPLILKLLRA